MSAKAQALLVEADVAAHMHVDGGLHMLTPLDPLLFVLPTSASAAATDGCYHEAGELLETCSALPANAAALRSCLTAERLAVVCASKCAGGEQYFRCALLMHDEMIGPSTSLNVLCACRACSHGFRYQLIYCVPSCTLC